MIAATFWFVKFDNNVTILQALLDTGRYSSSVEGVLGYNLVSDPSDPMAGFVSASIDGWPWTDTMWSRDAGVFLRELVQWGRLETACQVAGCSDEPGPA